MMKTVIVDRSAIFASRPRGLARIAIFNSQPPVFEAMIAEASQPLPSTQNKLAFENSSSSQVRNK